MAAITTWSNHATWMGSAGKGTWLTEVEKEVDY